MNSGVFLYTSNFNIKKDTTWQFNQLWFLLATWNFHKNGSATTTLRFRVFTGDVFIYEGEITTFYKKRDKEVAANTLWFGLGAMGLAGSDAVNENPFAALRTKQYEPIVNGNGQALRFVLATRALGVVIDRVRSKIANNEPLQIATSYPNTAVRDLKDKLAIDAIVPTVGRQMGGIQALPWQFRDKIDAVFELVQTGDSLRQNRLKIIEDNITPVSLCTVTPYNLLQQ